MHDCTLPGDLPQTRRFLARHGLELTRKLLQLRRADVLGQSSFQRQDKLRLLDAFSTLVDQAEAEGPCWSLDQLELKGSDLIQGGMVPGPQVGRSLKRALEAVWDGKVSNRREALLEWLSSHPESE